MVCSVHEYHDSKACVLLRNHYPASTTDVPTAVVSIEGMLDNFRPGLLQVGAWLNVIGNVRSNTLSSRQGPPSPGNQVSVDATTIWSAGAIKLEQYTATVREYQKPLRTG